MTAQPTRYVVGLGNPGRRYEGTRHNLGFMLVDALAKRWNATPPKRAFQGRLRQAERPAKRVLLLEPETFMNRSGQAVAELVRFYKADVNDLLVVLDDMAIEPGRIRIRGQGSAGGHNGLMDIINRLGTQELPRLRIGIGAPPPMMDSVDYVLGKLNQTELALAAEAIERACQAVEDWIDHDLNTAMNRHNDWKPGI